MNVEIKCKKNKEKLIIKLFNLRNLDKVLPMAFWSNWWTACFRPKVSLIYYLKKEFTFHTQLLFLIKIRF